MKERIVTKPTPTNNLTFDDLYEEISSNWQEKARKLRVRRERALQRAVKSRPYRPHFHHASHAR